MIERLVGKMVAEQAAPRVIRYEPVVEKGACQKLRQPFFQVPHQ
jgi:hypothetical protein